ncbi:MAG: DUF885 domain-containing protein [Bacteroidetes bacterium]|nr:DUF885 domain-containing protein [Bacteroidota bacterium]
MSKKIIGVFALALVFACNNDKKRDAVIDQNVSFDNYKTFFIEELWQTYPGWALGVGKHDFDSILVVPNEESRKKELQFANNHLDSLKKFSLADLSNNNKTDYYLIENLLRGNIWSANELKSYEWNPSNYNVSEAFSLILSTEFDNLENRIDIFYKRMANVPAYFEAAKQNIKNPTIEHTQLAIDQNLGGLAVFETELEDALAKSTIDENTKTQIFKRADEAIAAIKDYADWLKNLKNDNPRSFRLGKELYAKKFEFDIQSGNTVEEIYQKALTSKETLHVKMAEITHSLWNKYFKQPIPADTLQAIKMMIDKLSTKHVEPDSFQTAIEQQIPVLIDFIRQKDLIYIDPSKPLVVRKEPAYMAGVAGASISSPGPYDKEANTYYNFGSLESWTAERAESYLREYNHYILQILNIHEAIPGHYTQLVYSNQSPSLIKSILGNGTMIEGWAVYTELMMLENGYGNNEPEMWLMYYKWNLRTVCNTILDYSVHVNNFSKEEALNLLVNEAFQQQAEAEGKWRRVTLTQVQLCSYFTGFKEIYEFREEYKTLKGKDFDLKKFHEKFLSYGSAPVKNIREMMLGEN